MIDTVRISAPAKDQLITLKRRTGLKYWNELGRWAVCRSLAEPTMPPDAPISAEGGIEIEWRTFTGPLADVYLDLIAQRCVNDGLIPDHATMHEQMHRHLHRGIGYLVGDRAMGKSAEGHAGRRATGVADLLRLGLAASDDSERRVTQ